MASNEENDSQLHISQRNIKKKKRVTWEKLINNEFKRHINISEFVKPLYKSKSETVDPEFLDICLMNLAINNQSKSDIDFANDNTGQDIIFGSSNLRKRKQKPETLTKLELFRSRFTHFIWDDAMFAAVRRQQNILQFVKPLYSSEDDLQTTATVEDNTVQPVIPVPTSLSSLILMMDSQMKPQVKKNSKK